MIKTLLVCPGQIETAMFEGVKTPSPFFAPVLDPNTLARKIVEMLSEGKSGTLYMPFYTNFLPLLRAMPSQVTNLARRVSGMDFALNALTEPRKHTESVKVHSFRAEIEEPHENDRNDLLSLV